MTKEIQAVYEQGIIRPLQPLELPEGARLDVIVITHDQPRANGNAAEVLAEIAALPLEGLGHKVGAEPGPGAQPIRSF